MSLTKIETLPSHSVFSVTSSLGGHIKVCHIMYITFGLWVTPFLFLQPIIAVPNGSHSWNNLCLRGCQERLIFR